jgi:hypothetical protein
LFYACVGAVQVRVPTRAWLALQGHQRRTRLRICFLPRARRAVSIDQR